MAKTIEVLTNDACEILVLVQRDQPDAYFLHFSLEEAEHFARRILNGVTALRVTRMCQEQGVNPDDFVGTSTPGAGRKRRRAKS